MQSTQRRDGDSVPSVSPPPAPGTAGQAPMGPSPRPRRTVNRWVAVGASAVVGLVSGVGVVLGLRALDDSSARAAVALVSSQRALGETMDDLERADRIADLNRVGARSDRQAVAARSALAETTEISDERIRRVTRDALTPTVALLETVSRLERLTPETLDRWQGLQEELSDGAQALGAAQPAVTGLALAPPIELAARPTEDAGRSAGDMVEGAQRELRAWVREKRTARRQSSRRVRVARRYRKDADALLTEYRGTRQALAAWTAQLESDFYATSFAEDFTQLSNHKGERERIRATLAALDPPSAVESQHARLITVIDSAIGAMDSAIDGEQQWQDCLVDCPEFHETPAWNEFQRRSDQISSEFPAARSALEAGVGRYINRLERDGDAPPMPEV